MIWQAQEMAPGTLLRRAMLIAAAVAGLLAMAFASAPAMAGERIALVIGNSAYTASAELKNARNDAEAISAALTRLGFRVIKGIDADQQQLRGLVRSFAKDIANAEISLFFYAGHALQLNGNNYLVPIDAKLESEADVDFEAMDLNFVLRQMERKDGTAIVLLDACRNNPLASKLARKMGQRSTFLGRGLARVETGVGTFIGFATQPDNVAFDGLGENSPFTAALLKHIETPGLDIEVMMRRVREDVIGETGGRQVPWSNSSLIGDRVVLKGAVTGKERDAIRPVLTIKPVTPDRAQPEDEEIKELEAEIAFWNSVKDSGSAAYIRSYLSTYPQGSFAALARAMIEELENETPPAAETLANEPAPAEAVPNEVAPAEAVPLPRSKPVANLAPEVEAEPEVAPEPEAPPVIEKKPPAKPAAKAKRKAPKKAVAPKPPAKKLTRQKAPRREAISTPQKDCDYCYACLSDSRVCRRNWVCGAKYRDRLAQGLCVWRR